MPNNNINNLLLEGNMLIVNLLSFEIILLNHALVLLRKHSNIITSIFNKNLFDIVPLKLTKQRVYVCIVGYTFLKHLQFLNVMSQ